MSDRGETVVTSNGNGHAENRLAAIAPPPPKRRRVPLPVFVLLGLMVIGGVIAGVLYLVGRGYEATDDAFIEGHSVTISPQVAAAVKAVRVEDNQFVHKGDLLVELDSTDYDVALEQTAATVTAMKAKVEEAKSQILSSQAQRDEARHELEVSQANSGNAESDYKRFKDLSARDPGAVSRQQIDAARAASDSNKAQVDQATAKLAAAEADIETDRAKLAAAVADVTKALADAHKAEVNLGYCKICAPCDGRITRKDVEPGIYTQVGQQFFIIVPDNVWVVANYKETQLDRMRAGNPVEISVDAFPDLKLRGTIDSFQSGTGSRFSMLPAENATGNFVKVVQRVPVKVLITNLSADARSRLSPGMSVEATVDVH